MPSPVKQSLMTVRSEVRVEQVEESHLVASTPGRVEEAE